MIYHKIMIIKIAKTTINVNNLAWHKNRKLQHVQEGFLLYEKKKIRNRIEIWVII